MRKYFVLILLLSVLFIRNIYADELQIHIRDLMQENKSLTKEDGMYIANSLDYVYIDVGLENADSTKSYYVYMKNNSESPSVYETSSTGAYLPLPSFTEEVEEYIIKVCGDEDCTMEYTSTSFYLKNTKFSQMLNSKMYITSIKQGGNEITPDEYDSFTFNNKQDIYFTIKGENLISDLKYTISDGVYDDRKTYLGSQLEEGITYIYNPNNREYFYIEYILGMYYSSFLYKDTEKLFNEFYKGFVVDESLGDYEANLIYSNHRDKKIETFNIDSNEVYIIDGKYHNNDNKIIYKVDGNNFQDKEYSLNLEIKSENEIIYTKKVCVNGLLLNDSYEIELDNLLLESDKIYSLNFDIEGVSNRKNIRYINKSISVQNIKQDDNELALSDDTYIATDFKRLTLTMNVDSLSDIDKYVLKLIMPMGMSGSSGNELDFTPDLTNEIEEYIVLACDNFECDKIYAIDKFKIKFSRYQELKNSKIVISNVMQGGQVIEPNEYGTFEVNNKQDITYTIKGENLFEGKTYTFYNGYKSISYSSSELEKGVTFTQYTSMAWYLQPNYYIDEINFNDIYYFDGNEYHHNGDDFYYISFDNSNNNNNVKDFNMGVTYSDNKEIDVIVNADIYSNNKKLNLKINGNNFENKDYNVSVKVMYHNEPIYENNINVNGLELNDNYQYTINNLELETVNINDNEYDEYGEKYEIYVAIENVTKIQDFYYKHGGSIASEAYYQTKKLSNEGGGGGEIDNSSLYFINPNIINDKISIKYSANNLIDNRIYDYKIIYTISKGYESIISTEIVKTGTISGADLMDNKLIYELNINKNLEDNNIERYTLVLRYNEEYIYRTQSSFMKSNNPMITDFKVKSNNTELNEENDYYLVNNNDITLYFKGIGFDNEKNYTLYIETGTSKVKIEPKEYPNLDYTNKEVVVSGSELNNGYSYKITRTNNDRYSRINYTISEGENSFPIENDTLHIEYSNYTNYIKGDMNSNSKIDLKDIILLIKKYLKTDDTNNEDIIIGDMNDNGKIDLKDIILLIKKYLKTD